MQKKKKKKTKSLQQHVQWLQQSLQQTIQILNTELETGKNRRFEQWQNF